MRKGKLGKEGGLEGERTETENGGVFGGGRGRNSGPQTETHREKSV